MSKMRVREDWSIRLDGPVEEVSVGTISPDLVDAICRREPIPGGIPQSGE